MRLIIRYTLQCCIAVMMIVFFCDTSHIDDHLLAVVGLMIHILTIIALIRSRMSLKDIDKF